MQQKRAHQRSNAVLKIAVMLLALSAVSSTALAQTAETKKVCMEFNANERAKGNGVESRFTFHHQVGSNEISVSASKVAFMFGRETKYEDPGLQVDTGQATTGSEVLMMSMPTEYKFRIEIYFSDELSKQIKEVQLELQGTPTIDDIRVEMINMAHEINMKDESGEITLIKSQSEKKMNFKTNNTRTGPTTGISIPGPIFSFAITVGAPSLILRNLCALVS